MKTPEQIIDELMQERKELNGCSQDIWAAYQTLKTSYDNGGKLLICGNGGSAADSEHIVGELMKGFILKRPLNADMRTKIKAIDAQRGETILKTIQGALPAISLVSSISLSTAVLNDNDPVTLYAQQVIGLGKPGDIILGISTSGNAENIIAAFICAKALGLKTIGLTGENGGKMKAFCDVIIRVPHTSTPYVQELHLPVYHTICKMIEVTYFTE